MKTIIGVSHFFKNNTPKFWQILGDIGLVSAAISGMIMSLPAIFESAGLEAFVLPALLLKVNKYCLVVGAITKLATKFFGVKIETPKV